MCECVQTKLPYLSQLILPFSHDISTLTSIYINLAYYLLIYFLLNYYFNSLLLLLLLLGSILHYITLAPTFESNMF